RGEGRGDPQRVAGMPGPARIVDIAAPDRDHVGLALGDDGLGLARGEDHANRAGWDADFATDALGELHLIIRADERRNRGDDAAARAADEVAARLFERLREDDRVLDRRAALDPIDT